MAMMLLRRGALSSARSLSILRSSINCCDLSCSGHSSDLRSFTSSEAPLFATDHGSSKRLGFHFSIESRRGFAKGRSSKDGDGDTIEVVEIGQIKAAAVSQMDAAIVALSRELSKLRTGRASPGMLDHIIVESSGVKMSLSRVAVVSVLDPQTLSITPYDPNTIKELENAIVSSPLSINPQVDGNRLIAPIPPLTKEHIQAMCKVVAKSSEDVKQSIRRARQKALDTIKKEKKGISKDDAKRMEKEVDDLTKKFVKSAEDMCKAKEKEISSG